MKTATSGTQSKTGREDRTVTKETVVSGAASVTTPATGKPGGARQAAKPWWHPASWFARRRGFMGKAGGPGVWVGRPGRLVQQELALENIKPCRNDLRDADWELARPAPSGARLAFLRTLAGGGVTASPSARPSVRGQTAGRM